MKILAIERDETACNHYRIIQPLAKLKEFEMADVCFLREDAGLASDFAAQKVLESDIILVPRPASESWFKFLKLCRQHGKIIINDYDDDPFNTSPLNPYYRFVGVEEVLYQWPDGTKDWLWQDGMSDSFGNPGWFNIEKNIQSRDMFRLNFKKADLVTCTTDILKETLSTINPNTVVLPNLIDLNLYPKCEFVKKEIRIGWQGGVSHYEDLWLVHKAVERICKKYDNVKFVFFGDYRFYGLFKNIPDSKIEWVSWVRKNAYPYRLATLNLDIGLCPIVDNVFNRNKSAIKFFEYSAVGAATIASNLPPYNVVMNHGVDSLLVEESEDAWFDAIDNLIQNKELREKLSKNAYENIEQNHNADKSVYLWRDAYQNILKNEAVLK